MFDLCISITSGALHTIQCYTKNIKHQSRSLNFKNTFQEMCKVNKSRQMLEKSSKDLIPSNTMVTETERISQKQVTYFVI